MDPKRFFSGLEVNTDESDERYAQVARKMEHWLSHYPTSAAQSIAQAGCHLSLEGVTHFEQHSTRVTEK
ncbi:MAG: hypothetical protein ACR2II_01340 [Chthoniobacterales bacterium]